VISYKTVRQNVGPVLPVTSSTNSSHMTNVIIEQSAVLLSAMENNLSIAAYTGHLTHLDKRRVHFLLCKLFRKGAALESNLKVWYLHDE
jgi:hypothetical protein